jgi:hypothetical protein
METKNHSKGEASKAMNDPQNSKQEKSTATKQPTNAVPKKRRHIML